MVENRVQKTDIAFARFERVMKAASRSRNLRWRCPCSLQLLSADWNMPTLPIAHLRVSQIAMTVADNAGRYDPSIDESDINELDRSDPTPLAEVLIF